jgi:hypothetical protein
LNPNQLNFLRHPQIWLLNDLLNDCYSRRIMPFLVHTDSVSTTGSAVVDWKLEEVRLNPSSTENPKSRRTCGTSHRRLNCSANPSSVIIAITYHCKPIPPELLSKEGEVINFPMQPKRKVSAETVRSLARRGETSFQAFRKLQKSLL